MEARLEAIVGIDDYKSVPGLLRELFVLNTALHRAQAKEWAEEWHSPAAVAAAASPVVATDGAMKFVHDQAAGDDTCLHGYVPTTRLQLENAFGQPNTPPYDDGKVQVEWCLCFENGVCVTIYDWKRYDDPPLAEDEVYWWHIGGPTAESGMDTTSALRAVEAYGFKCVSDKRYMEVRTPSIFRWL